MSLSLKKSLLALGLVLLAASPALAERGFAPEGYPHSKAPRERDERGDSRHGPHGPERLIGRLAARLGLTVEQTDELARYAELHLAPTAEEMLRVRRELRRKVLIEGESEEVKALKKQLDELHERGYKAQIEFSSKLHGMLDEEQKARLQHFGERMERFPRIEEDR